MAAILQLRKGTDLELSSIGNLSIGELFYNTDKQVLQIGTGNSNVTLSRLGINTGSIEFTGDITLGGNIFLGDEVTDTITITGKFDSNLVPSSSNQFDLGSATKQWKDVHAITGYFGNGIVSGSSQIIESLPIGTVSGSSQIIESLPIGTVSGSSQINYINLNSIPSGIVSGSSQVDYDSIQNQPTTITSGQASAITTNTAKTGITSGQASAITTNTAKTGITSGQASAITTNTSKVGYTDALVKEKLDADGVISGSSQVTTSLDLRYEEISSGTNTLVSGSSQVDYSSLSGINNNIISASSDTSQVDMIINGGSISANLKGGVVSGSIQILGGSTILSSSNENFNTFSSSVDSRLDTIEGPLSTSLDSRLDSLEGDIHTHSNKANLDTINQDLSTNSDVTFNTGSFTGNMTIVGDLTVLGAATEISSTELRIEDKLITVASGSVDSAAADGAGIEIDGAGVSLQWDHNTTSFVLNAKVSSSVGFKGEGGELTGIDTDQVTEGSNLYYTDTRVKTKLDAETVISGSSQVDATTITNFDSNVKAKLDAETVVSGSSQIVLDDTDKTGFNTADVSEDSSNLYYTDARVKAKLDTETVISGSSQVVLNDSDKTGFDTADVSEGTNLYYTDVRVKTKLDTETVISGSSQVDADQTTGWAADVRTQIDNVGLISGSSQVTTSLDVRYESIGSGIFSGSSQVDADSITNFDSNVKAKLDADTVVSGSTFASNHQGSFTSSINGVATNVDLGLNTNDSPTFNALSLTGLVTSSNSVLTSLFIDGNSIKYNNIGTAALLHYSSSIADSNPNVIGTAYAVKTYIDSALVEVGAGDITRVTAGAGMSGSTDSGNATVAIDSGSAHFTGGVKQKLDADGVISGSSQLYSDLDSRYNNELGEGVVSGSSQVVLNDANKTGFDTADVSEGTNLYYTDVRVKTKLDADGVISGSSQIDHDTTTNFVVNEHIDHSSITLGSGKGLSGGGTIDTNRSLSLDTGSVHFQEGVELVLPAGTVSGSSQIVLNNSDKTGFDTTDVSEGTNLYYTDTRVKIKLDTDGVISGSSQFDNSSISNESLNTYTGSAITATAIQDSRLDQLSTETGSISTEQGIQDQRLSAIETDSGSYLKTVDISSDTNLAVSDTSEVNMILTDDTLSAELIGGVVSGSSQVSLGGDVTGTANDVNVGSVQGVALTSGEATQIAAIGTTTISATQWGYLGGSDQNVKTTSDVTFASASLSNVVISGNLTVLGDAVELGVSELTIEDKTITVASGSADSAAADGAGIIIAGADESITWNHANTRFNISDDIHVTGTIQATDDIIAYASSDRELKNNISPIENPLEKINSIGGYSFDWNTEKQHIYKGKDYGVVAQEIEEILPELVQTREDGYKAVKYDKLVSLLIEGIKELSNEVTKLKQEIGKE